MTPETEITPKAAPKRKGRQTARPRLPELPVEGSLWLQEAIAMQQWLLRRVMDYSTEISSLTDLLNLMKETSIAHSRIAALIKTEQALYGGDDTKAAFNQVLTEMIRDIGLIQH